MIRCSFPGAKSTSSHRRYFIQNRVALGSDASERSKAIFYLLIESGFLYCFTWVSPLLARPQRRHCPKTDSIQVVFFIVYWSGPQGNFLTTDMISQLTVRLHIPARSPPTKSEIARTGHLFHADRRARRAQEDAGRLRRRRPNRHRYLRRQRDRGVARARNDDRQRSADDDRLERAGPQRPRPARHDPHHEHSRARSRRSEKHHVSPAEATASVIAPGG